MATTPKIFNIFFVLTAILGLALASFENYRCSDFGAWQRECAGRETVACDVPYESGSYCISQCNNNGCSYSSDAARDFKNYICERWGYSADYVVADGKVDLAIHRNRSPSCGTYDNQFNYVPYAQMYRETKAPPNDKIPK